MSALFNPVTVTVFVLACGLAVKFASTRIAQYREDRGCAAGVGSDLVIESVDLDPPDGSTLFEQTPVHAAVRFRFTKPGGAIGIWVRIFDEEFKSQYFGSGDRMRPGTHVVTRGAYLTEPGTLNRLTVCLKT